MNIVWVGAPFFCESMGAGHVHVKPGEVLGWDDIVQRAGFVPDALVVGDNSRPPFVLGVENFPCPTVLYAVDTHIHSWLPWYGQAFDACMVSLKDHMAKFTGGRLEQERLWWSPPYAPDDVTWTEEKSWDCVFVGHVADGMPGRKAFLEELARRTDVKVVQGNFRPWYSAARTAVNFCEAGDLNFRVFEATGCGAALVTPRLGHGQRDIFGGLIREYELGLNEGQNEEQAREAALQNAPQAAAEAAAYLEELLAGPWRELGRQSFALVEAGHRAKHRAAALRQRLEALPGAKCQERRGNAAAIRENFLKRMYLHWAESLDDARLRTAYLKAAQGKI